MSSWIFKTDSTLRTLFTLSHFRMELHFTGMKRLLVVTGLIVATSGGTAFVQQPLYAQGIHTPLPPAKEKVVAAVYKFRDLSEQAAQTKTNERLPGKPNYTGILLKALETSGWFIPTEHGKIGNLLNEPATTQSVATQEINGQISVPAASFLLEAGVGSHETSMVVGKEDHADLGKGSFEHYQQDRVTVYLRVLSTQSGTVLKTIYASKTILSQLANDNTYRYVSFLRPLEAETGLTAINPGQLAVTGAIEQAVQGLIIEGFQDGLWLGNNSLAVAMREVMDRYNQEKLSLNEPAAPSEKKLIRIHPRINAPFISLHPYAGMMRYSGDYTHRDTKGAYGLSVEMYVIPSIGLQINAASGTMASQDAFSVKLTSLEANAVFRPLPFQRWSPILYGGVGMVSRSGSTPFQLNGTKYGQAQGGIGIQFSPSQLIGFRSILSYSQPFTDSLDGKIRGNHKDYYTRFTLGVVIHLGHFKMKTTPVKFTQVTPKG